MFFFFSRTEIDASSAVCKFNLNEISATFQTGNFYGSDGNTANDAWSEVRKAPSGSRPGYNVGPNIFCFCILEGLINIVSCVRKKELPAAWR